MRRLHPSSFILHPVLVVGLALGVGTVSALAQNAAPPPAPQRPTPNAPSPAQQELDRLYREGLQAYNRGDFPAALKAWQAGLEKAQALQDARNTAGFLNNMGNIYLQQGQIEKAIEFYTRSLALKEKSGNSSDIARSLNNLGNIYYRQGQYEKAFGYYQRALFKEKLDNLQEIGSSLSSIGQIYQKRGQYEQAKDYLTRALALFEQTHNSSGIADTLNFLGLLYSTLGQFEKAKGYLIRSLALREQRGSPWQIAYSLGDLGNLSQSLGQFEKAMNYYQRSLALFERIGNPQDIAKSLDSLGAFYWRLGQYERARDYLTRALALREPLGNTQEIASSHNNLGLIYSDLEQYEKALDNYNQALNLFEKWGDPQQIASCLNNLGNLYYDLGKFDKALGYHERAQPLTEKLGNPADIARNLDNLGNTYAHMGQFEKAKEYHTRALLLFEKIGNPADIARSLHHLGDVYLRQGQFEKSREAYARALRLFESVSLQVGEASQIGAFQQSHQGNLYALYATLLCLQNQPGDALALVERGRGRGLAKQARQSHVGFTHILKPQEAAQLQRATDAFAAARKQWQNVQALPVPPETSPAFTPYKQQLAAVKARYQEANHILTQTHDRLLAAHPEYRRLQGADTPDTSQFLRLSRQHPDTLYLEYALVNDRNTLLFALHRGQLRAFSLAIGRDSLQRMTQDWREALQSQSQTEPKRALALYTALLSEAEKAGLLRDNAIRHLALVADGPLLDVAFAALRDSQGKRLVERFALSSPFSLTSLTWPNAQRPTPRPLLCIADPGGQGGEVYHSPLRSDRFTALPFARREGKAVVGLFQGGLTLTGAKAAEASIKREMGKYAVLHFATHAVADGSNGMLSALILAPEPKESRDDGTLEAREIVELPLSARLAVLSACETAQGQKSGGEGLIGLAWAFRAAGVPAIVASQWKVEDEATSKLMVAFYKALKAGKRKDEALREAMLLVKKEKPQPYYWAAFQVIGDTGALPRSLLGK